LAPGAAPKSFGARLLAQPGYFAHRGTKKGYSSESQKGLHWRYAVPSRSFLAPGRSWPGIDIFVASGRRDGARAGVHCRKYFDYHEEFFQLGENHKETSRSGKKAKPDKEEG
jgi:hypothetical protein